MDLKEIEEQADVLLERLKDPKSAADTRDICFRLDGLYRGAQIKATATARQSQGRCGAESRSVWTGERMVPQTCVISATHSGWHKSETGMEWNDVEAAPLCGVHWSWQGADSKHFEICTQPAEHAGLHYNRVTDTTIADNQPLKPVADRLHELVSYLNGQSVSEFEASKRDDSMGSTMRLAVSKAYDDAAEKLQDLLQEGGI